MKATNPSRNEKNVSIITKNRNIKNKDYPNLLCFIVFITCLILLIPLSITFWLGADPYKLLYGHDRFGNTCGVKNTPIEGISCSGQDMTLKPITLLRYYPVNRCSRNGLTRILSENCINECTAPRKLIFNRCYPPQEVNLDGMSRFFKLYTEVLHVLSEYHLTITVMTLSGLILPVLFLYALKYLQVNITFWILTTLQITVATCFAIIYWRKPESFFDVFIALGATLYIVFIMVLTVSLHKKLPLTLELYDKSIKAILANPILLIQSILEYLLFAFIATFVIIVIFLINSNVCLWKIELKFYLPYIAKTSTMLCSYYMIFILIWIFAFAEGVQTILVSKTVTKFESLKDRSILKNLTENFYNRGIYKFLGPIACGSLIITVLVVMKSGVEYIIRKVYVQSAKHSTCFQRSLLDVIKLLKYNLKETAAFSGFAFILSFGSLLFILSCIICIGLWINWREMLTYYPQLAILIGVLIGSTSTVFIIQATNSALDAEYLIHCEKQLEKQNQEYGDNITLGENNEFSHSTPQQ